VVLAQLDVCQEQVEWATAEKRTFLRQRIEARLAALQLQNKDFPAALSLIGKLLTEVGAHSLLGRLNMAGLSIAGGRISVSGS